MRSPTKARRNNDSDARMLAAVAAASPRTIREDRMATADAPAAITINHKAPAILALSRGDVIAFPFALIAVMLVKNVAFPKGSLQRPDGQPCLLAVSRTEGGMLKFLDRGGGVR